MWYEGLYHILLRCITFCSDQMNDKNMYQSFTTLVEKKILHLKGIVHCWEEAWHLVHIKYFVYSLIRGVQATWKKGHKGIILKGRSEFKSNCINVFGIPTFLFTLNTNIWPIGNIYGDIWLLINIWPLPYLHDLEQMVTHQI